MNIFSEFIVSQFCFCRVKRDIKHLALYPIIPFCPEMIAIHSLANTFPDFFLFIKYREKNNTKT